ncbi:Uncharacterised protein [Vibrio cholerae]|nr:Uncharacterised protein [Vibrio cholerae]
MSLCQVIGIDHAHQVRHYITYQHRNHNRSHSHVRVVRSVQQHNDRQYGAS